MSEKRTKYTAAEKAKIALEAIKSELTLAQISSKYGAHPTQINAWKKQALALLPDIFSDKNKQERSDHAGELGELYEQIGRLKVENDFLKKSVRCSVDERREWVEANHPLLSMRAQCQILELNRSSIYYSQAPRILTEEQLALLRLVDEVYTKYPFFGTRQMSDYISLHKQ